MVLLGGSGKSDIAPCAENLQCAGLSIIIPRLGLTYAGRCHTDATSQPSYDMAIRQDALMICYAMDALVLRLQGILPDPGRGWREPVV